MAAAVKLMLTAAVEELAVLLFFSMVLKKLLPVVPLSLADPDIFRVVILVHSGLVNHKTLTTLLHPSVLIVGF